MDKLTFFCEWNLTFILENFYTFFLKLLYTKREKATYNNFSFEKFLNRMYKMTKIFSTQFLLQNSETII